jgi:hypothetical protein
MKKALRVLLLLVLMASLVSACTCGLSLQTSPELERGAEKATVEAGIEDLMRENGLTDLSKHADGTPTGARVRTYEAGEATNDMTVFPSPVWCLYPGHTRLPILEYHYTVENDGTVRQFGDPAKMVEYNAE